MSFGHFSLSKPHGTFCRIHSFGGIKKENKHNSHSSDCLKKKCHKICLFEV